MNLHALIESHWQHPRLPLTLLLWPLSRLFQAACTLRRLLYRTGCLNSRRLPVPLAVVGNIHAGGTGKTPVTAALVQSLQQRGIRVGIVSRGYGRSLREIHVLTPESTAAEAGDEPLMLCRLTGAPTAVGTDRHAAAQALLARHSGIQLVIADDGLQHYALHRDIEIAVYPAADAARYPDLLPNGGLREPFSRLFETDAVVLSNCQSADEGSLKAFAARFPQSSAASETGSLKTAGQPENRPALFYSHTRARPPYRFVRPADTLAAGSLKPGDNCAAAAAIARPERFFQTLRMMGFPIGQTLALPDHAAQPPERLPQADYVFLTEKDAAKLPPNAPDNIWILPVCAEISPDLAGWLVRKLGLDASEHGGQKYSEPTQKDTRQQAADSTARRSRAVNSCVDPL